MTLAAAGAGLGMAGALVKGIGGYEAGMDASQKAVNAAVAAKTAAAQTSTNLLDELSTTLGNISAIRASTGADVNSPTTMALKDRARVLSGRQRGIAMGNGEAQAAQDQSDAGTFAQGAMWSLIGAPLEAAPSLIGMFK